ncbi:MAG: hypothetical protein QOE48_2346 [Mycobacterium sp.]|nr:hypothetical protein [Mycobacterium sp.]
MSDAEAPDSMGLEVLFDLSPDLMCLASHLGCHLYIAQSSVGRSTVDRRRCALTRHYLGGRQRCHRAGQRPTAGADRTRDRPR